MNELILLAVAQGEGQAASGPGLLGGFMPLILIFAVFYFLVIRPQSKRQREHRSMLTRLKKGDEIVTNGGLIGTVTGLTDEVLTVELGDRVKVRVLRGQVATLRSNPAAVDSPAEQKKKKDK